MMDTINATGAASYQTLMAIVPPRPSKDGEAARNELRQAGYPVFDTLIRRSVAFTKAAVAGVTVRDLDDTRLAGAWEDYRLLGDEIRGKME